MTKYKFIKEQDPDNPYDNTDVHLMVETDGMETLVQAFEDFCLAVGFHPDTVKEYISDE